MEFSQGTFKNYIYKICKRWVLCRDSSRDGWIEKFIKRKWRSVLFWAGGAAEKNPTAISMQHFGVKISFLIFHKNIFESALKSYITVFPHIVAAATILFWIHLVRKLFKFSYPLCNENLNSFLTRWGNYSREETIWGNTVYKAMKHIENFIRK